MNTSAPTPSTSTTTMDEAWLQQQRHQLEMWFYRTNDPSHGPQLQWEASQKIQEWINQAHHSEHHRSTLATLCFGILQTTTHPPALRFAALTTLGRIFLDPHERASMRQYMVTSLEVAAPSFLRNKAAWLLSECWLVDLAAATSSQQQQQQQKEKSSATAVTVGNFLFDMQTLSARHPSLFLKTMETMLEDFVSAREDPASLAPERQAHLRYAKDYFKGYHDNTTNNNSNSASRPPPPAELLFTLAVDLLAQSLNAVANQRQESNNINNVNNNNTGRAFLELAVLALQVHRGFFVWTDLLTLPQASPSMQPTLHRALEVWLSCLHPQYHNDTGAPLSLAALACWREWWVQQEHDLNGELATTAPLGTTHRTTNNHNAAAAQESCWHVLRVVLAGIQEYNVIPTQGESEAPIEVVIQAAQLIDAVGQEMVAVLFHQSSSATTPTMPPETAALLSVVWEKVVDFFYRCLAYDDIDVSGAVLPLANRMALAMTEDSSKRPQTTRSEIVPLASHIPRMLRILSQQMPYPPDFDFDFDEDDDVSAEEEMYRVELSKFFAKLVTAAPDTCLRFVGTLLEGLAAAESRGFLPTPNGGNENNQEGELLSQYYFQALMVLRFVFHYGEGIRPSPGIKTVLRNADFVSLLHRVLNSSLFMNPPSPRTRSMPPPPPLLCLFYETAVRYGAFYKKHPDGLHGLLQSMTGTDGLQHGHTKVRSRCCYLLLRLVKAVVTLLRPLVETAVQGIQGLLSNSELGLRSEDKLYLFETIGLLLGKTDLPPDDQQRYLAQVMTPHVSFIRNILAVPTLTADAEHYGEPLSHSIAALAFLSKGWSKNPPEPVQIVLFETLQITMDVLQALPTSEIVRNKVMVFLQRMIQSIGVKVLPRMPEFLSLLITHCNHEDILFVSQIFNQLCIKFKDVAAPSLDPTLLPFLRKCQTLSQTVDGTSIESSAQGDTIPPHLATEQLSVRKLGYSILHHIAMYKATVVLLSPSNVGSLEELFRFVQQGSLVRDPIVQKSCLRFFRDVLDQWGDGQGNPHYEGLVTFVCQVFIPALWQNMMTMDISLFDERDAQQARNVSEVAHILSCLQGRHGSEMVLSSLQASERWNASAIPQNVDVRSATDAKVMEDCLMRVLASRRIKPI